jgi:signal transduction histidine kinase
VEDRPSWRASLVRRVLVQWRTVREDWAAVSRWALVGRLALPVLLGYVMAGGIGTDPWKGVGAALVVLALLARFTMPAAALLLVVALVSAPPTAVLAIPTAAYGAARRIAAPRRAAAVFGVAAVMLAFNVAVRDQDSAWVVKAVIAGAVVGAALMLPGAVGALVGERARRVEALRERNAILERAQRLGDEQARLQERARIAGEMHDLLGHRLSLISLYAGALEMGTRQAAPTLSEQAELVRATARTALDELREVLGILKVDTSEPDTDAHGDDAGTCADISALVLASQRAGVPVQLTWEGEDLVGVDGLVRRAAHRVVREALTNVHKHAPGAATDVVVERERDWVRVEVSNALPAQRGQPAPGTSMGLVGLQERVRLVGGVIRAGASTDNTRFVVGARLPLEPVPSAPAASGDADHGTTTIDHAGLVDRQTSAARSGLQTGSHVGPQTRGSTGTMRKTLLFGLLGVVVVCFGGVLIGAKVMSTKAKEASITPETYAAVQNGQAEDQVRKAVGEKGSFAKDAVDGQEPQLPAGSTCVYAMSSQTLKDTSKLVYRFCFVGGKLVEKREIQAAG